MHRLSPNHLELLTRHLRFSVLNVGPFALYTSQSVEIWASHRVLSSIPSLPPFSSFPFRDAGLFHVPPWSVCRNVPPGVFLASSTMRSAKHIPVDAKSLLGSKTNFYSRLKQMTANCTYISVLYFRLWVITFLQMTKKIYTLHGTGPELTPVKYSVA